MSPASDTSHVRSEHLGIELADYDARIRTFIPDYEEMLDVAAAAIPVRARTIVDLGIGTGALAARCLASAPAARVFGIDLDPAIVTLAARRLRGRATFATGSFLRAPLPRCDAAVASFSLHHVRTRAAKAALYRRIHAALRPRGLFISVDCQPATDPARLPRAARRLARPPAARLHAGACRRACWTRGRTKMCTCRSTRSSN